MSEFKWGDPALPLVVSWEADRPVTLSVSGSSEAVSTADPAHSMVEVLTVQHGRALTNTRVNRTRIGDSLRYVSHADEGTRLTVEQESALGVRATTVLEMPVDGVPAYRARTVVLNTGDQPLHLQAVSTIVLDGLTGLLGDASNLDIWSARNEWDGENRWFQQGVEEQIGIPDINPAAHGQAARGSISFDGLSTWSTGEYLPVAALSNSRTGGTLLWQIESNGPWTWELNSQYDRANWLSLALMGPTDLKHAWLKKLKPGQSFETVSASFVFSDRSLSDAFASMTRLRRADRRQQATSQRPLIFNDYMNTLMGDPTTEKLLPLIDAAADAGARYFCIDAGWYDDGSDWWPSVGEWKASETRFAPEGLGAVLTRIRERGMLPGLWLEPEVVGVNSPVADQLPEEAFMRRNGIRIREHDRCFLDLRSRAAREHLDSVFDRVLGDYGARYIKWDYNVTPGLGPDHDADSPGDGLLQHSRAYLEWFEDLRRRYPDVVFEACSSGAQRQDPLTTSRYDLQSTSDQQDYRRYATIAAAAPAIVPAEQAGNWAYPNPSMSDEQTAFAMVNGLAGRLYLSGYLNKMSPEQLATIREALDLYPEVIGHNSVAVPQWPLGLPQWNDQFVALALADRDTVLLFLWERGDGRAEVVLPLEGYAGRPASVEFLFPAGQTSWRMSWDQAAGALVINNEGAGESARVIRVEIRAS